MEYGKTAQGIGELHAFSDIGSGTVTLATVACVTEKGKTEYNLVGEFSSEDVKLMLITLNKANTNALKSTAGGKNFVEIKHRAPRGSKTEATA